MSERSESPSETHRRPEPAGEPWKDPAGEFERIAFDVESYPDWFLAVFLGERKDGSRSVRMFESVDGGALNRADRNEMSGIMSRCPTLVSYNGTRYDVPMLRVMAKGGDAERVNAESQSLVTANGGKVLHLTNDPERHVDCERLVVGMRSLKELAAMLHMRDISELPRDPGKPVGDEESRAVLRDYCVTDCENTLTLHDNLHDAVELRRTLNEKYPMPKSRNGGFAFALESQIGEKLIASRCGERAKVPTKVRRFKWTPPDYLSFRDPAANELLDAYAAAEMEAHPGGGVTLPPDLRAKGNAFRYRDETYTFGTGGLHSAQSKPVHVNAIPGEREIRDYDVASYYPAILLRNKANPVDGFGDAYKQLVDQRLSAKARGDKHEAAALKIGVNGVFGKLDQPGSAVYSPETFLDVTATGQFALLMLVEDLSEAGATVLSANTDGVIVSVDPREHDLDGGPIKEWQRKTGFTLERTDYSKIAMRDVNNYLAVGVDGSLKGKGVYGTSKLRTKPMFDVCSDACREWITKGTPPREHVGGCDDLRKFLTVRKMTAGVQDQKGERMGSVVRYYKTTDPNRALMTKTGKHLRLIPDGADVKAVTILDDPPVVPEDLNREFYIERAEKMILGLGDRSIEKFRARSQRDMFDLM